jgi:hypothetical protein
MAGDKAEIEGKAQAKWQLANRNEPKRNENAFFACYSKGYSS